MATGKIFTAYEKPEAPEPIDRVLLVREGFAFWAFILNFFWLLWNKMWLEAVGYVGVLVTVALLVEPLHLNEITEAVLQLFVQVMLGAHARDLLRMSLVRRGYRFAGVIVASGAAQAEQRYFEHVA